MASLLLDTHILLWWDSEPHLLTKKQTQILTEGERSGLAISVITLWEVAKLVQLRKLHFITSLETWLHDMESAPSLTILPLTPRIIVESVNLGSNFPKDPADQLIVATARVHGLPLMTADKRIQKWGRVALA